MTDTEQDGTRDDGIRPLIHGTLWCAGAGLVVAVVLYAAFWLPYRNPGEERPYPLPILSVTPDHTPASEVAALQGYEWVNREAGIVRIPIEDAMTIAVERLTVRKGVREAPAKGMRKEPPTDAGSGRTPRPNVAR